MNELLVFITLTCLLLALFGAVIAQMTRYERRLKATRELLEDTRVEHIREATRIYREINRLTNRIKEVEQHENDPA